MFSTVSIAFIFTSIPVVHIYDFDIFTVIYTTQWLAQGLNQKPLDAVLSALTVRQLLLTPARINDEKWMFSRARNSLCFYRYKRDKFILSHKVNPLEHTHSVDKLFLEPLPLTGWYSCLWPRKSLRLVQMDGRGSWGQIPWYPLTGLSSVLWLFHLNGGYNK